MSSLGLGWFDVGAVWLGEVREGWELTARLLLSHGMMGFGVA